MSPKLAGRFFTTESPGKRLIILSFKVQGNLINNLVGKMTLSLSTWPN